MASAPLSIGTLRYCISTSYSVADPDTLLTQRRITDAGLSIFTLFFGTFFFGTRLFAATCRRLLRLELITEDLARVAHGQVRRLRFAETFFRGNWEELDRLLPQLVELGLSECVVLLFTPLGRHKHACRRFVVREQLL